MKMLKHTYTDPTGGGEDITVTAPEWVTPPSTLTFRTGEHGDRLTFDQDESATEEVEG